MLESWGDFWGIGILPYVILVFAVVVFYRVRRSRRQTKDVRDAQGNVLASSKTSVVVLKEKFVRGEIDQQEYDQSIKEMTAEEK